jgi:threonine dehydrogenase-like Zn-dependent dehydrogenase
MERGIRLIGNGQAPVHKYWEQLLQMIREGKTDPLAMVTHRVSIDDLETIYQKFDARADNIQKIFVETKFSDPRAEGSPELTRF